MLTIGQLDGCTLRLKQGLCGLKRSLRLLERTMQGVDFDLQPLQFFLGLRLLPLFGLLFLTYFQQFQPDLVPPFGDALGILGDTGLFELKGVLLFSRAGQLLSQQCLTSLTGNDALLGGVEMAS